MIKNNYFRFFLYFIIIIAFIGSIKFKINHIIENSKKNVPTFVGEWNKNGKPVYIKKVIPENVDIIEKITGKSLDRINITSFVNLEIKSILKNNLNFFIELKNENEEIKRIPGKIVSISNNIDYKTGMYIIKLKLDTKIPEKLIKNFYTCHIIKNKLKNIIILPNESIKKDIDGNFVFVIKDQKFVSKRYVELGYNDGFNQVIQKGLNFGDGVVIEGMSILKDNDKIDIVGLF